MYIFTTLSHFRELMKHIRLNEDHFEMLTVPPNLDQLKADLSIRDFQLPTFPLTIEIPYNNRDIPEHVLELVDVLNEGQI